MIYDAIVILANEMNANGVLNDESTRRADLAVKLINELEIPFAITCGWNYRKDSDIMIADAFKSYLVSVGLNSNKIITELNSRDTVGDAYFTRVNIAEPKAFNKICVVTSQYHVPRTKKIFDFIYGSRFDIDVKGAEVHFDDTVIAKESESELAFDRTFNNIEAGNIDQIKDALRSGHPFYNGEIYPAI